VLAAAALQRRHLPLCEMRSASSRKEVSDMMLIELVQCPKCFAQLRPNGMLRVWQRERREYLQYDPARKCWYVAMRRVVQTSRPTYVCRVCGFDRLGEVGSL
jgi:hypothetical protein